MQNYLIPIENAPFSTGELSANSLVYAGYKFQNQNMFIFDETMFNRLLQELHFEVTSLDNTDVDGLVVASLQKVSQDGPSLSPIPVPRPSNYSNHVPAFDITAFEKEIGRPILVHKLVRTYHIEPINDENYHIWIYATPVSGKKSNDAKKRVLNKGWSREDYPLLPTGTGKQILDLDGQPIAEYVDNNLYVLYNLKKVSLDDGTDNEVLRLLLTKIIYGEENFAQALRDDTFNSNQGEFLEFCRKMEFKREDEIKQRVDQLRREISEYSDRLITNSRELRIAERDLVNYDNTVKNAEPEYQREFVRIRNIKKIVTFELGDNHLSATTVPMICEDPRSKKIHSIGVVKITLKFGSRFGVRFENQTRTVSGRHHPHTDTDGYPCLGNMNEVLPQLVMQNQFATILIMAIKFLESVNTDDAWGDQIRNWPIDPEYAASIVAQGELEPQPEPQDDEDEDDEGEYDEEIAEEE